MVPDFLLLHLLLQEKSRDSSRKDNAHRNDITTKQLTERSIGESNQQKHKQRIYFRCRYKFIELVRHLV